MQSMTSKERVTAAISWQKVDRFPVFAGAGGLGAQLIGRQYNRDFVADGAAMGEAALAAWSTFQDDFVQVYATPALLEAFGASLIWPQNDYPQFKEPVIATPTDVDRLELPDPRRDKYMLAVQEAIRIAKKQAGDQILVATIFYGVFNVAARLLGSDKLLISTIRDPDLVHRLCRKIVEGEIRYAEALAEAGAGLIGIGDAMSSPACISPQIYRSLALPYLTEVVQGIRCTGAYAMYHPCGGEYPIIDQVGDTGADLLYFSELVDLGVAQQIFVKRAAVVGGVDPAGVLFQQTPQEIEEHVRQLIAGLRLKTGAIIAPGCSLSPNMPLESIKAMVATVKKYGGKTD